jgi:transcriptional regulator with XRE-family HTH domain
MTARESLDPGGSLWNLIAVQVRRHREERKVSGSALGALIGLDRSSVSRIEGGTMKLMERYAKILDREWQTEHLFTYLVGYARSGHDKEWLKAHFELEARASELRIWELGWIPGLFQTERYARAMYAAAGLDPREVDAPVTARMVRQEVLERTPRPLVWVYLDQGVIEQPVGGPEVMREQLAKLLELAQLSNITIRIMPRSVGAHVGRDGSFKIMTVAGGDNIYTESCEGGRLTADGTDVRLFRVRFDRIGDWALPVDASLRLINEVMEAL